MKYVLVNHSTSARSDGVGNYSRAVREALRRSGTDTIFVAREESVPRDRYAETVRQLITTRFRSSEVLIEAPEVNSPTRLLPAEYRVHVRLHCPTAFVNVHNRHEIDWAGFERELEAVRRAHVVSSPSYALLDLLRDHLDVSGIHVYKNPPPPDLGPPTPPDAKRHDVAFLGRFRRVKGVDFLNPVLSALPRSYSVVLAGRGFEEFSLSPAVRCRVQIHGEVLGPERDRLVAGARVALMLSRFENCSMVVLECLAAGTVVVGWRVGGHAEIAGPDLIRLAPFGDIGALVDTVVDAVEGDAPSAERFEAAVAAVAHDFQQGWRHIWEAARLGQRTPVYRGLDCSRGADRRPITPS